VRWEGYGSEDDMWEPIKNLENAKGALRAFKAQGQATKGGEYHVTASITEELKRRRNKPTTVQVNEPEQSQPNEPSRFDPQPDEPTTDVNGSPVTHEE
jgi:hypothetical protein